VETTANIVPFFTAGGTLRPDAPSYIARPADEELYQQIVAAQFCYVLTARQRGKSSLMVRVAGRLRAAGVRTAIVDLSALGTQINEDQWYLGIARRIAEQLQLQQDVERWWQSQIGAGAVQRFGEFLREAVIEALPGQTVLFLDEIDTTLGLPFRDDFFAALRQLYNQRAVSPEYERLTLVLLGVAAPTDLIADKQRTPFNIGRAISLGEFRRADATPLAAVLDRRFPGCGERMLDRIFFWTRGHPYLTQRLCAEAAALPAGSLDEATIDALVERLFLTNDARNESNLRFVRRAIEEQRNRRPLLNLYRRILASERIAYDQRSPVQERLRLAGLVRAEDGVLAVRNEIYQRVFNDAWARAATPVDWNRIIIAAASTIIVIALIVGFVGYQQNRRAASRIQLITTLAQTCRLGLATGYGIFTASSQDERIAALTPDEEDSDGTRADQLLLAQCILHKPLRSLAIPPSERAVIHQSICDVIKRNSYNESCDE
jgi:AAA-like domain